LEPRRNNHQALTGVLTMKRDTHRNAQDPILTTRRHFFGQCGVGVGKIALASLLTGAVPGRTVSASRVDSRPLAPKPPHFAPKAKAVIHLFMAGGPSQLDLFDYKPKLADYEGKSVPPEVIGGPRYAVHSPDSAAL